MPKRILLADDSITIQKVVELTFSDGDYEVTAVNNGAKAIQKLGDMKPDIILSDIIMPEKNGYEVCEYVKSHPEYRNIPVVLLTGTFEPFDPDRAEKAGCDAVVTKPFESQSLIHKVEELIAQSRSSSASSASSASSEPAPAAEPEPEPQHEAAPPSASPWVEDEPSFLPEPGSSPFTTSGGSFPAPPEAFTHGSDVFAAPPAPEPTKEMPFDSAPAETPFSGETRAFPRMSFDDLQPPPPPPPAEPAPWDAPAEYGGETRAFDRMSVDDLESMQHPLDAPADIAQTEPAAPMPQFSSPLPAPEEAESPFGAAPDAEQFSSETRAFERMSFDDLQRMAPQAEASQPEPQPEPVESSANPWDEPADSPMMGGDAGGFPSMSFGDMPSLSTAPEPEQEAAPESSPWDEQPPAFGGETRAFPKMSFEELASMQPPAADPEPLAAPTPEPEPEAQAEPLPWDQPAEPAWASSPEPEAPEPQTDSFSTAAYAPFVPPAEEAPDAEETLLQHEPESEPEPESLSTDDEMPFAPEPLMASTPAPAEPPIVPAPYEPAPSPLEAVEAAAEPEEPVVPPPALAPESPVLPIRSSELSEDQVDRIARRVVELMSDQVVRNIAWEVIPDLAEMVVKERIRQLESE